MKKTTALFVIMMFATPVLCCGAQPLSGAYTSQGAALDSAEEAKEALYREKDGIKKAFQEKRQADINAFREKLEKMPEEKRPDAIRIQNRAFFDENLAFMEKMHAKNREFLFLQLSKNSEMAEDEIQNLIMLYEEDYRSNLGYTGEHHMRNMEKLYEIATRPGLTLQQKIDLYKAYREEDMRGGTEQGQ